MKLDRRPRLVCIPAGDREFSADARALLDEVWSDLPGDTAEQGFAQQLRLAYPTAIVRARDPLADLWPEDGPVWYVTKRSFASRIKASVDIAVARELVFDVYIEKMPEWQIAVKLEAAPRRAAAGSLEYGAEYEFLGRRLRGRMRIVDLSRPTAVRVEADGMGVRVWYVTTFHGTADGTRVEVAGDYSLPTRYIPATVAKLAVERRIAHDIERAHEALRVVCLRESRATHVAAAEGELAPAHL